MEDDLRRVAPRVDEEGSRGSGSTIAYEAIIVVLEHLRNSRFSSTTLKGCEVTLPDGTNGHVNLTVTGATVNKLWAACVDSIVAQARARSRDSSNDN
jgi:hypothetical protein